MTRWAAAALVLTVWPAAAANAQNLSAVDVAAKVDAYYADAKQLTAEFEQRYTNATFGKTTTSQGKLFVKKPGQMRWDYPDKTFIADGTHVWMIDRANKQYGRQPMSQSVLPVAVTFLMGSGKLTASFSVSLAAGTGYGHKGDYVLELTPRKASAAYAKLWLAVDPKSFFVRESVVLETSKNSNRFRFTNPNTAKSVKAKWFTVDAKALRKKGYSQMRGKQSGGGKRRPGRSR